MVEHDRAPFDVVLAQALTMPGRCQRRDVRHVDQSMSRAGIAKRVDARHVRIAVHASRQWRARRIEIVERASCQHIGFIQGTQQARQCDRRKFGITADDQQMAIWNALRQCHCQCTGTFLDQIGKAQRIGMPSHRSRRAQQNEFAAFRHLCNGFGQPRISAGDRAMHAEAGGFRQGFLHDGPGYERTRIIGDAGAHCHGGSQRPPATDC